MASDAGSAVRELLLVLAVAAAGLLLAMAVAFGPWHPAADGSARAGLVELRSPTGWDADPVSS
ncbi:hypothetical protein GA0074695_1251 [Micromonospora viridifaciens]|uniref:Uncharacterized protein n=1 Tax=Micromonospora viridifaciens TaxID=1881 RepID=A0A1C4V938_MICVI|nr:hypothetical protein [Micromonospora viridifaciens]SCE80432.1 hypothetical protein GA0074695_1251 [Micromonospora viridifaciens]